jgi:hypothetical protein
MSVELTTKSLGIERGQLVWIRLGSDRLRSGWYLGEQDGWILLEDSRHGLFTPGAA